MEERGETVGAQKENGEQSYCIRTGDEEERSDGAKKGVQ